MFHLQIVHRHFKLDPSAVLPVMVNIAQIGDALWYNRATAVRCLRDHLADHHRISVGVINCLVISGAKPGHFLGKALF